MSALPLKADMAEHIGDVCFVPIASAITTWVLRYSIPIGKMPR